LESWGISCSWKSQTLTRNWKFNCGIRDCIGSGFEFGMDESNVIHVSFDVNGQKVVPETTLTLTKTGKLSKKSLSKTAYYDIYQDYVCSSVLRIARDMFALLPVSFVFVNAFEKMFNLATGHMKRQAILSVKYVRSTLNQLNFNRLDPSDVLVNFPHKMKFKKTTGFEPIDEVL
jgi:hypothetical protein